MSTKQIIGRIERADFPNLGLEDIEAKIDTGAFSSSLHCHSIQLFDKKEIRFVSFYLLDPDHPAYSEKLIEVPVYDIRSVKSSNGLSEDRVFINTEIQFFNTEFKIILSLANRSEMKYPVLIGRDFLKGKFLVDVSKKNLSIKNRRLSY